MPSPLAKAAWTYLTTLAPLPLGLQSKAVVGVQAWLLCSLLSFSEPLYCLPRYKGQPLLLRGEFRFPLGYRCCLGYGQDGGEGAGSDHLQHPARFRKVEARPLGRPLLGARSAALQRSAQRHPAASRKPSGVSVLMEEPEFLTSFK